MPRLQVSVIKQANQKSLVGLKEKKLVALFLQGRQLLS
jgi:hypothetical protein